MGSFLSKSTGNYSVGESLAQQLSASGYHVRLISEKQNRLGRLLDMHLSIWFQRHSFELAYVEVYSGRAFFWAETVVEMLRLIGKPIVLALHGGNLPEFAQRWPGRVRRLLDIASMVVAPSEYLQATLKQYRGDIRLIPNPIDVDKYPFRARFQVQPSLVWLRSFHQIYNPIIVPEVIKQLTASNPDIHITMIGPDKGDGSLQAMKKLADQFEVSERIDTPGAIPKALVPEYLSAHDIFLNTTNFDNTPVSVLEAMACGLCVVSTDVGGLTYLLENEMDALLVPGNDPTAMVMAVQRLLDNSDLSSRLSTNARRKVERFDWKFVLPQWVEVFDQVAKAFNTSQIIA